MQNGRTHFAQINHQMLRLFILDAKVSTLSVIAYRRWFGKPNDAAPISVTHVCEKCESDLKNFRVEVHNMQVSSNISVETVGLNFFLRSERKISGG